MSADKEQFKLNPAAWLRPALQKQADGLGFKSDNELAVVYLSALARIPSERVYEALAAIKKFSVPVAGTKRSL